MVQTPVDSACDTPHWSIYCMHAFHSTSKTLTLLIPGVKHPYCTRNTNNSADASCSPSCKSVCVLSIMYCLFCTFFLIPIFLIVYHINIKSISVQFSCNHLIYSKELLALRQLTTTFPVSDELMSRGCRTGAKLGANLKAKLKDKQRRYKHSIPSVIIRNMNLLANKTNEPAALASNQRI